ncbi:hypothetical protein [Ralstonia solanacearum]|uniref:hypothetical protein n=1 Tax=Ralstonia solanacearum TaxID=305 RepID=UPI0018D1A5C4|nr:hypothetical protein [Ralstonia solanacearum]
MLGIRISRLMPPNFAASRKLDAVDCVDRLNLQPVSAVRAFIAAKAASKVDQSFDRMDWLAQRFAGATLVID